MNQDLSIVQLMLNASWVVQAVVVLLMVVSVMSWAAIFRKVFSLKRVRAHNEDFEREFWSGTNLNDLYAAAAARWNLRVFANIAESETRHAAVVTQLAATVGVQPPVAQAGVYATTDLQAIYDQLIVLVNGSATGALRAGALIEETDITDLRRLSAQTTDEGSKAVIANLVSASVNHLGAFVRNLAAVGVTYQPLALTAEEFATMTNAAPGRGGMGQGKGNGNGMGGGNGACGADCTAKDYSRHVSSMMRTIVSSTTWAATSTPGTPNIVNKAVGLRVAKMDVARLLRIAAGAGFGQFLSYQVAPLLATGALQTVLEDFEDAPRPIHVVYPHARLLPTRTRAFIDFI
eukprot:gene16837-34962_t